ncbi:MAG: YicC family protein [Verrucomicrobia bacterium]|nr:YicC family protein [Verrucomicrobiota bacterium]
MTGHGRGECAQDGFKITVELSSVNRKQSEIAVNLPRELEVLEAQFRDEVNRRIARGRLVARALLHAAEGCWLGQVRVNTALARAYLKELNALARDLKLAGPVTLDQVLRAPGVLETEEQITDAEAFWPAVKTALDAALAMLLKMRTREGAHLAKDLSARIATMRRATTKIRKQAPKVAERYRQQLIARIQQVGLATVDAADERVLKEVLLFADRADISEELTRLESHFQQFNDCFESSEPVGRTLDFLAQEMNREINTIGSKANDGLIAREIVVLKTELEKFREQAQNVE